MTARPESLLRPNFNRAPRFQDVQIENGNEDVGPGFYHNESRSVSQKRVRGGVNYNASHSVKPCWRDGVYLLGNKCIYDGFFVTLKNNEMV